MTPSAGFPRRPRSPWGAPATAGFRAIAEIRARAEFCATERRPGEWVVAGTCHDVRPWGP